MIFFFSISSYTRSKNLHSNSIVQTFPMINQTKGVFSYATSTLPMSSKTKDSRSSSNQQDRKVIILRTATTRISYFSRKGNRPRRENVFSKHYTNRAIKYKEEKKLTPQASFPVFFYAATPFIRLKIRRRGGRRARLKRKITFRPRHVGERQGFLLFVKHFRKNTKSAKAGSFRSKFQTQRESITQSRKNTGPSKAKARFQGSIPNSRVASRANLRAIKSRISSFLVSSSASSSSAKSLREVRDEMHRRAFISRPNRWNRRRWSRSRRENKRSTLSSKFALRYSSAINGDFF